MLKSVAMLRWSHEKGQTLRVHAHSRYPSDRTSEATKGGLGYIMMYVVVDDFFLRENEG